MMDTQNVAQFPARVTQYPPISLAIRRRLEAFRHYLEILAQDILDTVATMQGVAAPRLDSLPPPEKGRLMAIATSAVLGMDQAAIGVAKHAALRSARDTARLGGLTFTEDRERAAFDVAVLFGIHTYVAKLESAVITPEDVRRDPEPAQ